MATNSYGEGASRKLSLLLQADDFPPARDEDQRIKPTVVALSSRLQGLVGERFQYVRTVEASWQYTIELSAVIQSTVREPRCMDGEGRYADG